MKFNQLWRRLLAVTHSKQNSRITSGLIGAMPASAGDAVRMIVPMALAGTLAISAPMSANATLVTVTTDNDLQLQSPGSGDPLALDGAHAHLVIQYDSATPASTCGSIPGGTDYCLLNVFASVALSNRPLGTADFSSSATVVMRNDRRDPFVLASSTTLNTNTLFSSPLSSSATGVGWYCANMPDYTLLPTVSDYTTPSNDFICGDNPEVTFVGLGFSYYDASSSSFFVYDIVNSSYQATTVPLPAASWLFLGAMATLRKRHRFRNHR